MIIGLELAILCSVMTSSPFPAPPIGTVGHVRCKRSPNIHTCIQEHYENTNAQPMLSFVFSLFWLCN